MYRSNLTNPCIKFTEDSGHEMSLSFILEDKWNRKVDYFRKYHFWVERWTPVHFPVQEQIYWKFRAYFKELDYTPRRFLGIEIKFTNQILLKVFRCWQHCSKIQNIIKSRHEPVSLADKGGFKSKLGLLLENTNWWREIEFVPMELPRCKNFTL